MSYSRKKRTSWRTILFYTILIAWPIIQFCVFYIGVNANSILLAFQEYSNEGELVRWGFGNFIKILSDPSRVAAGLEPHQQNVVQGGLMSLLTYVLTVVITIPLGLFFSYYIGKKLPASGFFRVILFLPSIIPEIVLVLIYKNFLVNAMPEIAPFIGNWIDGTATNPTKQYTAVMFYTLFIAGFGANVLMYSNAINNVSKEMLEAAKLDGAVGFREFWHIVLPSIFPTISVFIVTGVCGIFTNQIHLMSFYEYAPPGTIQTYGYILYHKSTEIIRDGVVQKSSTSILSAFGLLMTVAAIPLTFGMKWLLDKFGPSTK